MVFYESPYRVVKCLEQFVETFGAERPVSVSRELTKKFEQTVRGTAGEVLEHFRRTEPRGEVRAGGRRPSQRREKRGATNPKTKSTMNDNETSLQHNGRPARHSWWESLRDDLADRFSLSEDSARQEETVDMICRGVEFRGTNLWVLIFATMIASLGLNVNSAAVIIGAMLVSPLMGPIMGVGLSLGINDFDLLKKVAAQPFADGRRDRHPSTLYFFISPLGTARSELLPVPSPRPTTC